MVGADDPPRSAPAAPSSFVVPILACSPAPDDSGDANGNLAVAKSAEPYARIVVGPDYLVSRDGDRPHVEIMAAANPRNPRNLIAGAITFTRRDGGPATKAYVSHDGGVVWRDVAFAEQSEMGGADPQVAFTTAGTAIFATLATGRDETGRQRAFLHAYRSQDGGATWSDAHDLGASYDHPMLAADHTTGRFAGRLYMSVLYGGEYNLGVFRSEDDGRSWIGPVKFIDGGGERGYNVDPMLVLHDGALVVTFVDFPLQPEPAPDDPGSRIWTAVSTDGGATFSNPQPGPLKMTAAEMREARQRSDRMRGGSWSMFAVDRSERFRDRVYGVWPDYSRGLPRLVIAWTADRGSTWSDPMALAPPPDPDGAQQFQPAIGVNTDGVVGVTWYDTRDAPGEFAFHQYFAASLDGGATFTEPVRVSSALSQPLGSGNLLPTPTTFNGPAGELRAALLSAASRWVTGGDYMGLAVAADGDFHPVWADARGMGDVLSEFAPEVLNAHNGVQGGGALFVYDEALGTEMVLPPGGVSGAVLWRMRLADPLRREGMADSGSCRDDRTRREFGGYQSGGASGHRRADRDHRATDLPPRKGPIMVDNQVSESEPLSWAVRWRVGSPTCAMLEVGRF